MLFDTHCHIQFKSLYNDLDEVIVRCTEKNMILNLVGTQIPTSEKAIHMAEKYEWMYASIGIHPIQHDVVDVVEEGSHFTSRGEEWDQKLFEQLVQHPKVIAVGETGLDKFHIRGDKHIDDIFAAQKKLFLQHYELAQAYQKPLVIHVRDAHEEMIAILESLPHPIHGTVHCFTGNWSHAERYLSFGLHLGFTGVITFPPKKTDPTPQEALLEVIKKMPLERVLVETDAPYLAPQVYRGDRSEPWMVEECIKKIAEIRELSVAEITHITTQNAQRLFLKQ